VGYMLMIDQETLLVTAINTTTNEVTVQRGMFDSRPVTHTEGTVINRQKLVTMADDEFYTIDYNYFPRWGLRVVWPRTWGGHYGATTAGIRYPAIYLTGIWGYHSDYNSAWVDTTDELTADVTATDTTLNIQGGSGFDVGFDAGFSLIGTDRLGDTRFEVGQLIRLDDEFMAVTAVDATARTLTVIRGYNGSIPLAHLTATPIDRWSVHHEIKGACFTIAKILRESDIAKGGRIGVNEVSNSFEIGIPTDTSLVLKRLVRGQL